MEIVIALFVIFGSTIGLSAWLKNKSAAGSSPSVDKDDASDKGSAAPAIRTCNACGHTGEMKTWIANYTPPKLLLIAGFVLGYVPGLIFLVYYWGKYKCPGCGAVGKN